MEFTEYWQYTDWVTKTSFFALFALSIASWIAGIIRIIDSVKLKITLTTCSPPTFHMASDVRQPNSIYYNALADSVTVVSETGGARHNRCYCPLYRFIRHGVGYLHALCSIGQTGQAGLGQVAGPVGEALIMTGLGLAVAIPAVILYNIATRLNRSGMQFLLMTPPMAC